MRVFLKLAISSELGLSNSKKGVHYFLRAQTHATYLSNKLFYLLFGVLVGDLVFVKVFLGIFLVCWCVVWVGCGLLFWRFGGTVAWKRLYPPYI
jgi:hypothetical protein